VGGLSKIFVYPIKAMPGVEVDSVLITQGGALCNDRRWALEDERGRLVNGKNNKRIFSLQPCFDLAQETITFLSEGSERTFDLSDSTGLSEHFSALLDKRVFLKEDKAQGFPDDMNASGPTVISAASLEAVLSWYPNLSMDDIRARFRINLEIASEPAFWEDRLFVHEQQPKAIQIGHVTIKSSNPCARCSVPTKDPVSGKPYSNFYETFIKQRESSRPAWTDAECFDHWYRLSANTNINKKEAGKRLTVGDQAVIATL